MITPIHQSQNSPPTNTRAISRRKSKFWGNRISALALSILKTSGGASFNNFPIWIRMNRSSGHPWIRDPKASSTEDNSKYRSWSQDSTRIFWETAVSRVPSRTLRAQAKRCTQRTPRKGSKRILIRSRLIRIRLSKAFQATRCRFLVTRARYSWMFSISRRRWRRRRSSISKTFPFLISMQSPPKRRTAGISQQNTSLNQHQSIRMLWISNRLHRCLVRSWTKWPRLAEALLTIWGRRSRWRGRINRFPPESKHWMRPAPTVWTRRIWYSIRSFKRMQTMLRIRRNYNQGMWLKSSRSIIRVWTPSRQYKNRAKIKTICKTLGKSRRIKAWSSRHIYRKRILWIRRGGVTKDCHHNTHPRAMHWSSTSRRQLCRRRTRKWPSWAQKCLKEAYKKAMSSTHWVFSNRPTTSMKYWWSWLARSSSTCRQDCTEISKGSNWPLLLWNHY